MFKKWVALFIVFCVSLQTHSAFSFEDVATLSAPQLTPSSSPSLLSEFTKKTPEHYAQALLRINNSNIPIIDLSALTLSDIHTLFSTRVYAAFVDGPYALQLEAPLIKALFPRHTISTLAHDIKRASTTTKAKKIFFDAVNNERTRLSEERETVIHVMEEQEAMDLIHEYKKTLRDIPKQNVLMLCARLGEEDGVSLEAEKWIETFIDTGHSMHTITGRGNAHNKDVVNGEIWNECAFDDKTNLLCLRYFFPELGHSNTIPVHNAQEQLDTLIKLWHKENKSPDEEMLLLLESASDVLAGKIERYIKENDITLAVPQQLFSVPYQIVLSYAMYKVLERNRFPYIAHNHDCIPHRQKEFSHTNAKRCIWEFLDTVMPTRLEWGSRASIQSAINLYYRRLGLFSTYAPNIMDYGNTPFDSSIDTQGVIRKKLGLAEDDLLFVLPVRAVNRKGFELAIWQAQKTLRIFQKEDRARNRTPRKLKWVITGSIDEQSDVTPEYIDWIREYIAEKNMSDHFYFLQDLGFTNRPHVADDIKNGFLSLKTIYKQSNGMDYYSQEEGWGNAFGEGMCYGRAITIHPYPMYKRDIKPALIEKALALFGHTKMLPIETPEQPEGLRGRAVARWIEDQVDHNPDFKVHTTNVAYKLYERHDSKNARIETERRRELYEVSKALYSREELSRLLAHLAEHTLTSSKKEHSQAAFSLTLEAHKSA